MKKRLIICTVVILILSLIVLGIFKIISSIKKDQKEAKETMIKISENYDTFNNQINTFNGIREELAELMNSGDIYYATFYKNASKLDKVLQNYNKIRNEIVNNNKFLEEKCKQYYFDSEINGICSDFNDSFASIDKVYKKDVESYNNSVKKYNEWVNKNKGFKKVTEYVTKDK